MYNMCNCPAIICRINIDDRPEIWTDCPVAEILITVTSGNTFKVRRPGQSLFERKIRCWTKIITINNIGFPWLGLVTKAH